MHSRKFLIYRYRFLLLYILFGFLSLSAELVIIRATQTFRIPYNISAGIGFLLGLFLAFFLNIRFNFHIVQSKRNKALLYFTAISFISFFIQLIFRQQLIGKGISMDVSRFLISGPFFLLAYFLHRRLSFKEYKKVGVAIYADGVEDIQKIYNRIGDVADFIHIDIIDQTFKPDCNDVRAYRAEVVRAYWQKIPIEVHIMSKTPSIWLKELLPYVNTIYIHTNIDEDINDTLAAIRAGGCNAGIAISQNEDIHNLYPFLSDIKHVLLLAIERPGYSGQKLDMEVLSRIKQLDKHKDRAHFQVCVDGGVNNTTVQYLTVEAVVSGSFVLTGENPILNIMYLQTSGEYEKY